jgi:energy-coupling factor transport system permease protein
LTLILYLFVTEGRSIPPFPIWKLNITYEGLMSGLDITVRLVLLVWGTTLLTLTTSPMDLTDGMERMLRPFKRLRFPAGEVAMMVMIAIKFIPILLDEADRIIKAQRARGADFEAGGPMKRARSLVPVVVPMLVGIFRRADELAVAMEARCYQPGADRTHLKVLRLCRRDYIALGVVGALLGGVLAIRYKLPTGWGF